MSNHTPGPWHWDDKPWDYDPAEQAPWLVDENDQRVLSGEIKCTEANANLIAAAPDLLEALQAVVRVADRATVEFDMARDAIAKATGA